MAEPKTKQNERDVEDFLSEIDNPTRQADTRAVVQIMEEVTGQPPKMWGATIIGFGSYHYRYASGREGDWMQIAVSPRKQALTLYLMDGFDSHAELLNRLGTHSLGKSCLYVKRLDDLDEDVLRQLLSNSVEQVRAMHQP